MPLKSITKTVPKASKAFKSKVTTPKAKKAKTTPKKQPAKGKDPPKTPTPSPEPEGNSPTSPHSPFVYFPSDPQEKLYNFNCHSDPTSESEEEEEQEPGAPVDEQIELRDLNTIHNICNQNGTFAVPTTYPASYPIMTKKGGVVFVYKGYSFSCKNKIKNNLPTVTVVSFLPGIDHLKKKNGDRKAANPLKVLDYLNLVIDKKWVITAPVDSKCQGPRAPNSDPFKL
ncbi:hypothetical protein DSO57_1013156 [Entomophthora muscae]|uniref:Uncharacterized protein n=1 Tax=Entomophthora muscae TaxID=34485 RepID=A0ACC2UFS8_9FUNG|nr:hypothetical protein DSO57_1013156 [Entomophthora muscae]